EPAKPRVKMVLESSHPRSAGIIRGGAVVHKFAVAAVAHAGFFGAVPEVTAGGSGDRKISFRRIWKFFVLIMAVGERPGLLHKIARVSAHRPFMAIGADFACNVKIVEQDKLTRPLVMVRRDVVRTITERRIAV